MDKQVFYLIIETVFSACLFINALLFIPQAIKLYRTKETKGLSLLTFSGFNFIQLFTVLHAYINNDNVLFIGMLLSLITCGSVTGLLVFYQCINNKK